MILELEGAGTDGQPEGPRTAPPFVGRTAQLAWLIRALEGARGGKPRVVLVVGEAGIGKTRLLRELQAAAQGHGVDVCAGRGYEGFTQPFLPFVEALSRRIREMPLPLARVLGGDAEVLRGLIETGGERPASPRPAGDAQVRLLLAISRAVVELARRGPMLLLLDDLHWVDEASLEVFGHLVIAIADVARREPMPLLVVAATRPAEPGQALGRVLARFRREDVCQTLELGGLGEAETHELIRGLGVARPSHQMIAAVNEATRGNPLFIQEVVHQLVRRKALREQGGFLTTDTAPLDVPLPPDVTAAIAARIREVGEACRRTLALAAVLGDPFARSTLAAVAGHPAGEIGDHLREAERRGLLTVDGESFRFTHPLVRQVLYSESPLSERQRLHALIADALSGPSERGDEHVLEVAHHLIAAGPEADPERVIAVARRAGERAFAGAAFREAARFYQAALAAGGDRSRLSTLDRAELHYRAGLASFREQDVGPCLENYERAVAGFREADDFRGLARALMGRTRAYFTLASVGYGTLIDPQPLEQVAKRAEAEDPVLCGLVRAELAQVFWTACESEKAREMATRALETARQEGDDDLAAESHRALALVASQTMDVSDALANLEAGLACARRASNDWLESQLLQRLPLPLMWLGRLDDAVAAAQDAEHTTRRLHDWGDHSLAQGALVCVAVARGDFEAAERHTQQVMMMRQRSGYPWAGPTALPALARARALRGAWSEADDVLAYLIEPGQVFEDPGAAVHVSTFLMRHLVEGWANASEEVRAGLRERLTREVTDGITSGSGRDVYALGTLCSVVELAEMLGAPALAEAPSEILALAVERGVVFSSGWVCLLTRVLGVAATLLKQWEPATAWYERAVAEATRLEARPELGRALLGQATMLVARGNRRDRDLAADLVKRALPLFHALGMEPAVLAARTLAETLEAHVARIPRPRPAVSGGLARTERVLLSQLVRGRDDREIANELLLRPETVARQVRKLLDRIGVESRAAAVAWAVEHRLVPADELPRLPPAVGDSLAILLFTDLAGSTAMFERLGDVEARAVLRTHDEIVRRELGRHGGTEVKHTGDGFLAKFTSAVGAIEAAIAMQRAFAAHTVRNPDRPISARIGLDAGEPLIEEGDVFGSTVNAAARICGRAEGGHVLVSEVVRQLCAGKDLRFVDRGRSTLPGFAKRRFRLFEVPW